MNLLTNAAQLRRRVVYHLLARSGREVAVEGALSLIE